MSTQLASMTLNPTTVAAGGSVTCTLSLNQATSFAVSASVAADPASDATVPSSVTIPAGQTSASFIVQTAALTTAATVTIYANYNVTVHAPLAVTVGTTPPTPIPPTAVAASPTFSISLASSTPKASIHYTLDGSTPTPSSAAYTSAIPVSATKTIKAISVASGYSNSAVSDAVCTVPPTPVPPTPIPPTPIPPTPIPPGATFSDTFSSGSLDTSKWIVSNWTSNNYAGAGSNVTWTPGNLDFSEGLLRMMLTQPTASTSTCGEIQSKQTFGFGTYTSVMRQSSTAASATAAGSVVSGSDSAIFSYINNSQTEIDTEFVGNYPNGLYYTNWDTLSLKTYSQPLVANLASEFHTYTMVWLPTSITWSIDGVVVATHTTNIPQTPAFLMINFWGTNSTSWGGLATPGVTRYFYIKSVSFTPAA